MRRRPPSGVHWCRVGYRVHNPDEIQLDEAILTPVRQNEDLEAPASIPPQTVPLEKDDQGSAAEPEHLNELKADDYKVNQEDEYDEEEAADEDDGLGYYPDGVKRTLTDEQIKIFRHTELEMIARRERREKDGTAATHKMSAAEAAYLLYKPAEEPAAITESGRGQEVPYDQRHKRKWEGFIQSSNPVQGSMTYRRVARELDEKKSTTVDMDYGEDNASSIAPAQPKRGPAPGRRIISYTDILD